MANNLGNWATAATVPATAGSADRPGLNRVHLTRQVPPDAPWPELRLLQLLHIRPLE